MLSYTNDHKNIKRSLLFPIEIFLSHSQMHVIMEIKCILLLSIFV